MWLARWPERGLVSIDNRRVWSLKEHQKHVRRRNGGDVYVSAWVFQLPDMFASLAQHPELERLMQHYDGGDGTHLRLCKKWKR